MYTNENGQFLSSLYLGNETKSTQNSARLTDEAINNHSNKHDISNVLIGFFCVSMDEFHCSDIGTVILYASSLCVPNGRYICILKYKCAQTDETKTTATTTNQLEKHNTRPVFMRWNLVEVDAKDALQTIHDYIKPFQVMYIINLISQHSSASNIYTISFIPSICSRRRTKNVLKHFYQ